MQLRCQFYYKCEENQNDEVSHRVYVMHFVLGRVQILKSIRVQLTLRKIAVDCW